MCRCSRAERWRARTTVRPLGSVRRLGRPGRARRWALGLGCTADNCRSSVRLPHSNDSAVPRDNVAVGAHAAARFELNAQHARALPPPKAVPPADHPARAEPEFRAASRRARARSRAHTSRRTPTAAPKRRRCRLPPWAAARTVADAGPASLHGSCCDPRARFYRARGRCFARLARRRGTASLRASNRGRRARCVAGWSCVHRAADDGHGREFEASAGAKQ